MTHAVVVGTFLAFCPLLIVIGRHQHRRGRGQRFDCSLAGVCAILWITINLWPLVIGQYDPNIAIPLHVSDLTALTATIVLARPARWLRAILYFWGLGLGIQAFIQPDLRDGPAHAGFWWFWANHFIICGVAVYDLAARGFRPAWRDYVTAVLAGFVYIGVVLPLDVLFDVNYGYVGPGMPGQPSLIDHLGPWPWRVLVMIAMGLVVFALMVLPWEVARRRRARVPS